MYEKANRATGGEDGLPYGAVGGKGWGCRPQLCQVVVTGVYSEVPVLLVGVEDVMESALHVRVLVVHSPEQDPSSSEDVNTRV